MLRAIQRPFHDCAEYVCNAAGVDCSDPSSVSEGLAECCAPEHRRAIQERAWTSPIWYAPR